MKIKVKGLTLIELLIALSITAVLSGIVFKTSYSYSRYTNSINTDYCNNSILSFVNNAKQYCRSHGLEGKIKFDYVNNQMKFTTIGIDETLLDRLILPRGFQLNTTTLPEGRNAIYFDIKGTTGDACTISYNDKFNVRHEITIAVGNAYAEIKD